MRRTFSFLLLVLPLCIYSQIINLGVRKNWGWAEWIYETIDFRDDCTILKGYFVPSENGCWVISKMDEKLVTGDKEYSIIYTTLPINRHPRTTYKGGSKIYFEEHFEPILSTDGNVRLSTHDITFAVPIRNRKRTKPFDDLYPAYEKHIDTLICHGKYDIAAYLLNQYVKNVWLCCTPKVKKKLSMQILAKYHVSDFFLDALPDADNKILLHFRNIYHYLNSVEGNQSVGQMSEISRIQTNIMLNMNGTHTHNVIEWCKSLLSMVENYSKFNKCYENALSLYRKALVIDGQTHRIPELDKEIIEVCSHIYKTNNSQYLEHLMNIASDLDIRPSKASYETTCGIKIWKEVRDKSRLFFPDSWRYANALKNIADYNYHHRHFDIALMQYLSIDSLYKLKRNEWISEVWYNHDILSPEQSVTYVDLLQKSLSRMIGSCYYLKGEIESAIKYDSKNPYYYCALGDNEALTSLCKDMYEASVNGLKNIIKSPTIIVPGAYYEEVFDMAYLPALTTHIPYFAFKMQSPDLYKMAYDGALVAKEFRLTAENRLRRNLLTTQDSISKDYVNRIGKEMQAYKSMIKNHDLGALEKHWDILNLQRSLVAYLDSIGALQTLFPKWTDVYHILKEKELAIEFVEFPLWNQNQSMYGALVLRKDSAFPKLIPLFEERQLKQVSDTLYYQCKEMTDLVWKPLQAELEGIKNIYFSPSGAIYNIGIEYLPGMEKYKIYRLSSTRELVTDRKSESENRAVLYGGLDYYAGLNAIPVNRKSEIEDVMYTEHADVRGMNLRGGKEALPQTKIEVEQIGQELKEAQWDYKLLTDGNGTEESFKSLAGKRLKYLHLSTHGFYYTPEEANDTDYDFLQLDNHIASAEDKALTRSGLILSGANHILEGDTLPDNVEDGILTAKEIADVDLRGLDLVVLSACQTGLGDITQSEGVFGLQRGFKKAGANSILMSLWEVDDKAAQILMTQFYRNLLSGQSKRQSLLAAQEYLRKVEDGKYDEPKYWAAFILLDGIN